MQSTSPDSLKHAVVVSMPRARARWKGRNIDWTAYAFLLPFLVPFFLFTIAAIIFGIFVSFTDWRVVGDTQWIGFDNFTHILKDPLVGKAFVNTLRYGLYVVPSVTILGFIFALFVNQRWPGYVLARFAFYAPNVVSATVIGLVWVWMLDTRFGVINQYLGFLGIANIPWLTNTQWALLAVSLASIWWDLGLAFVLFLAGLQEIDQEIREAAAIDGANRFQITRFVIVPLLRPTFSMVITLQLISTLRIFSQVLVMTDGGPANASMSVIYYVYRFGLTQGHLGYASAVSLMLFVVILVITFIQLRVIRERN